MLIHAVDRRPTLTPPQSDFKYLVQRKNRFYSLKI